MNISLNVLNHLGINLYSNTPAVLAEVIANSWDAGAAQVDIKFDTENRTVTISDDGCGMTKDEINKQYLYIGYKRRDAQDDPKGRKPMGRKGIGKLSLFSIADKIHVQSCRTGKESAFLMDAEAIKSLIKQGESGETTPYHPQTMQYENNLHMHKAGTTIKITNLKKKITNATMLGLKKRLARRFSVIGGDEFKIFLNGKEIKYSDRDYFHKARFLFEYGDGDFAQYCKKLDTDDDNKPITRTRKCRFNKKGNECEEGKYEIKGWIAIAHHSHDLDGEGTDDNINNIVIVVRGKVAQEDILHQFRIGGLITKYIYGEIQADFLDEDDVEDISTSSRQKIVEDAPRYKALKKFIKNELAYVRSATDKWKETKGKEKAFKFNPLINEWYDALPKNLQKSADTLFGTIEKIETDEKDKSTLYVNGIIAFEKIQLADSLDKLNEIGSNNLHALLDAFRNVDELEGMHYYEIVHDRLCVIEKLQKIVNDDEKEKVIQEYIYEHLWLLDPAWERATDAEQMEKPIQQVIENVKVAGGRDVKNFRLDIQYKKISGAHVIIELKRSSLKMQKGKLEDQIKQYMTAVEDKLKNSGNSHEVIIEGVCIVGGIQGWDNDKTKARDIASLASLHIKILTYDELIKNARSAYSKFLKKESEFGKLRMLIDKIRKIPNS